jgi:hypothetical protein
MKKQIVEGKEFDNYTHKESGQEIPVRGVVQGDGHVVSQRDVSSLDSVYVSQGITVELGPFEFARVDIGVRAYYEGGGEEIWSALRTVISEVLAREEAALRGQPAKRVDVTLDQEVFGVGVYVMYGLTLKGEKKYESHRFDIGRYKQVEDGADILAEIASVGAEVEEKVNEQRDAIQGRRGASMGL